MPTCLHMPSVKYGSWRLLPLLDAQVRQQIRDIALQAGGGRTTAAVIRAHGRSTPKSAQASEHLLLRRLSHLSEVLAHLLIVLVAALEQCVDEDAHGRQGRFQLM